MVTRVKSDNEVKLMRESGRMLAHVLATVKAHTEVGMSTKEMANIARDEVKKLGGKPAFLGYQGYPDVLCVSINEEVVHGIPKLKRIIQAGDIVSIDFGVNYQNMITDSALTFIAGRALLPAHSELVKYTEVSLYAGVDALHNGVKTGDIGAAVEKVLNKHRFGIVRDLVGHGVGHYLHEEPNVPNYGKKGTGFKLKKNMTVAIEPMATLGGDHVYIADDGWTVLTEDGSWAAHFEHTLLITEDSAEILTQL